MPATLDVEQAVAERYKQAAQQQEMALCCPVSYDPKYLSVIPDEIIERLRTVTHEQIQKLAQEIFVNQHLNMAVVGKYKDAKQFEDILKL